MQGFKTRPSYNDLNPRNLLFDEQRIWVVDWEAAFQNDRYVDWAIVANHSTATEAQEETYLKAYFGDALDDYKRARFFLMQVCLMFYAMSFMRFATVLQDQAVYETAISLPTLPRTQPSNPSESKSGVLGLAIPATVSNHLTMNHFAKLREFRYQAYALMGNGRDALFDLMDAVLVG